MPAEPEEVSDPVVEPELIDLDAMRQAVDKAVRSLTHLAGRLKENHDGQYAGTAWSFVGELQEICDPYVRRLSEATERLLDGAGESREGAALGDEPQQIFLEQVAQLETTLSNLQYMDFDSSFSTAVTRLRTDIGNTLSIARRLQKALRAEPEKTGEQHAESAAE